MEFTSQIRRVLLGLSSLVIMITVGCKKDDPLEFPKPHTGGTGSDSPSVNVYTPPISGTGWIDISPNPNYRLNALATINNKLFFSLTNINYISGFYNGNGFNYCAQGFASFGSGSGIEKIQQSSNGDWLGTGSMGPYGVYSFDTSDESYPWGTQGYTSTNTYAAVSFQGDIFVTCGAAPRVRKAGVQAGDDLDASVFDLIEYNGELYAGGAFENSGANPMKGVAKWDGTNWQPVGSGLDGTVLDLEIYNGNLIAVGNFDQNGNGNTDCRNIASWNGSTWTPLGTGLNGFSDAGRKALANGSELIIGGTFETAGGVNSPNVVKWNGTNYEAIAGGAPESIGEIAIVNGILYVANQFELTNSNFLLRLN